MTIWRPLDGVLISSGQIPNYSAVNKFGRNSNVGTAADEDVWDGGGTWSAPTGAQTHDIVSTDAADNSSGGTGAQTIMIFGLTDWTSGEVAEIISLSGTTPVTTINNYVIIHRMMVLTSGSGRTNAGDITATASFDSTVTAQITAGKSQTLMAIYGLPMGSQLVLTDIYVSMTKKSTSGSIDAELFVTSNPDDFDPVYRSLSRFGLSTSGSSSQTVPYTTPHSILGPAIVKIRALDASVNNLDIVAGFNGVLIDE